MKYQAEADRVATMLGCPVHVIPNGVPVETAKEALCFNAIQEQRPVPSQ